MPNPVKYLRYGGVSGEEQEVVIRLDCVDGFAHIWSSWPRYSRRLQLRFGQPHDTSWQGEFVTGARWKVPVACIVLRTMPKKSNLAPGSGRASRYKKKTPQNP